MSLLLDAGALIAYERGSKRVQAHLELALEERSPVKTSSAVVAQAWRNGARQVTLAKLLAGVEEVPLTPRRARDIGALLARARASDVVDAALIELSHDGDEILTSDPDELVTLARASSKTLIITRVG